MVDKVCDKDSDKGLDAFRKCMSNVLADCNRGPALTPALSREDRGRGNVRARNQAAARDWFLKFAMQAGNFFPSSGFSQKESNG